MSHSSSSQKRSRRDANVRPKNQQFFNMTGSSLMIYSPNESLEVSSSLSGSDCDESPRHSPRIVRQEYSLLSESVTSEGNRNYRELTKETSDLSNSWHLRHALHSTPSDNNNEGGRSEACHPFYMTVVCSREKSGELDTSSTQGVGEPMKWRQSLKEVQIATNSGHNMGKETWGDCVGPSDIDGSYSSGSFEVSHGNKFWRSIGDSCVSDHEKKRVSFEDGCGWISHPVSDGKINGHKSILKVQGLSQLEHMEGLPESCFPFDHELMAEKIVNSASLNKKWLSAKRSSAAQQPDIQDLYPYPSPTTGRPERTFISGVRRRSEPPYQSTMTTKRVTIEGGMGDKRDAKVDETEQRLLNKSAKSQSATYLLHLKNTERISKRVEHIIKKFHLDLLDPKVEDSGGYVIKVNASTNNNVVVDGAQQQGAASDTTTTPGVAIQDPSSQMEGISVEQKASQTRSFSLRRPFSKFQKKTGSLDKSKSVAGSTLDKPYREDSGPRRPLSSDFHVKDSDSSVVEVSEQKTSGSIDGKLKKPKRKFSLNLFRKSRDRFTEAPSKDRGLAGFKGQANMDYESSNQVEDVGASCLSDQDFAGNAKRATSEASKVLSHHQQDQLLLQSGIKDQTELPLVREAPSREVKFEPLQGHDRKKKAKTESNKELWKSSEASSLDVDASAKSSSHVVVPLEPKSCLVFHDAVFYFPEEHKGDDEENSELATSRSEGKVPKPSKSSSLRVPAKGAISDAKDQGMIQRKPSILKRMRAFFGRSSSISSYNVEHTTSASALEKSTPDKEGKDIEEWRWSGGRGQPNVDPVRVSSSPSDKLYLSIRTQLGSEAYAADSAQLESEAKEPSGLEHEVKVLEERPDC